MELIIVVVIALAIAAFALGRARDSSLAKQIGHEVRAADPLARLEKLHELHRSGALTDAEYEDQKARILDEA